MSHEILWVGEISATTLDTLRSSVVGDYVIETVATVEKALTRIESHPAAAILFDLTQDDLNSLYLCQQIKARTNPPRVIAVNHKHLHLRDAILVAGADAVLEHPLDGAAFKNLLDDPIRHIESISTTNVIFGNTPEKILSAVSLLSHDLKSPISIIISSLEALLMLFDELKSIGEVFPLLEGTRNAAYRQMYLIDDTIDLPRLHLGAYPVNRSRADMTQVVQEALELPPYAANAKKITIESDLPPVGTLFADVDVDLVRRAVAAMIDNAFKFTIRGDHLKISLQACDESHVEITFEDNGRPIHDEYRFEIVRRAAQWEGRKSGTRTSVAAGLPFVLAVATVHAGSFSGITDNNSGLTTFALRLPVGGENAKSNE